MSRHTPGRWRVSAVTDGAARRAYIVAGDRQIAEVSERLLGDGSVDALADAQHIVNCVNALDEVMETLRRVADGAVLRHADVNHLLDILGGE